MPTVYSIRDLERLSGVKAHTLRIWEKRYGIIKPRRNANNTRYYRDEDLKKLLNIAYLNRKGIKISKIALLKENEISIQVKALHNKDANPLENVELLTISILELDEKKCSLILNRSIAALGLEKTMYELIYPLLDRLSMMWISGSLKSVHEVFIRYLIKTKVSSEIDKVKQSKLKSRFLIFLPENEKHELSLLFLHYILKKNNAEVINLGLNVSVNDIIHGCDILKPDYIFTIINDGFTSETLQSYIDFLSGHVKKTKLLFSGFQFVKQDIKLPENCIYIKSLKTVENYI